MSETAAPGLSCYVLMPSGMGTEYHYNVPQADFVYNNIIVPAVREAERQLPRKIELSREVDNPLPGTITKGIVTATAKADIVIADITGRNPNVFLELGIRYALRKRTTILLNESTGTSITQSHADVPFDVRSMRYIRYNPFLNEDARQEITTTIVNAIRAPRAYSDSLVFEFIPGLEEGTFSPAGRMPWRDYWDKILQTANTLREMTSYEPDAVIALTNGGAAYADFLVYHLRYRCPFISLWNDRHADGEKYIDNDFNAAILESLKRCLNKEVSGMKILLIDDIVGRAKTAKQACEFIKQHMEGCDVRFLPLICQDAEGYAQIQDFALSDQSHFVSDGNWHSFPFGKPMHGVN